MFVFAVVYIEIDLVVKIIIWRTRKRMGNARDSLVHKACVWAGAHELMASEFRIKDSENYIVQALV